VRAAVLLIAEFVARFKKDGCTGGRIVNVSTDAAQSFPTQRSYGASKSAMEAYTRSIAVEVGKYGIAINTVVPGPVPTGEPPYIKPDEQERWGREEIPLGRAGRPEDITNAIVFLVSDQASWITGRIIKVDGGHAAGAL
jgi:3-oxoacyl-[acyl-carrier protein] reductase